ncbi:hypothetical protein A2V82_07565 [candidate division KSB1 bacterium RBG_16_48_16]|nr:MAG: hypothetical protein A2V82_07565 [candidate division KSB1 bacterium RBG_16_48_16]
MLSVLIIDDDVDSLQALKIGLESDKYGIHIATSLKEAMKAVKSVDVDVVVTDLKLKDGSGLEILYFIQEKFPQIAVIIITAYASVESAVESIRGGAYEYLVKPFRLTELKRLLDRLNETISLRKENENLKQRLFQEISAPQLVGASRKFKEVVEFVKQIAPSRSTVLITGETGTGKEVIAYAIHHMSPRQGKPFVKINCGAIPENLLEAELFGYEKGAFTGATRLKKGKIELAQEGTLFLDEIGDLNPAMQVKLLRFLQSGEFDRLGSTETIKVDVRVIAATNTDLEKIVENGTFREDLFYRLYVISLHLPPLRDRQEDIPILMQHFIDKYNQINEKVIEGVDHSVIKQMLRHPWRGNVRELENMVERAVVLSQEKVLKLYHFPGLANGSEFSEKNIGAEIGMSMPEIEKLAIERTLQSHNYDKQKSALTLQIGLVTLYRKLKEYGIEEK